MKIFWRIVVPISKPVFATIALFLTFGYWNDWFQSALYISDSKLVSLQALLNNMMKNLEYIANNPSAGLSLQQYRNSMPSEAVRMAIAVVIVIPIPLPKTGGGYQYYMYDQMGAGLYPMGVRYDDKDAKVVAVVEQDDVKQILKTFHEWYNEGIINSDAATRPEDAKYKACSIAQGWSGAATTTWGPQCGVEAVAQKWGPTIVSNETVRGSLNCISANCAHPDKALEFLQLINTDTYCRDLFFYGVQGDNWDYTDDSKTKVHKNNADWSMAGYTQGSFFTVTPTDDFDFNQYDEVKELNEKAEPSVLLGFSLDTTNIADQLANCIQIAERYKGELMTGTADPEVMVPQMMEELRGAGFDEIVAEAQAQVDAFMAAQ